MSLLLLIINNLVLRIYAHFGITFCLYSLEAMIDRSLASSQTDVEATDYLA